MRFLPKPALRFCLLLVLTATSAGGQDSPWGIGSSTLRLSQLPDWIPQMVQIGIADLRAPGGYWNGMEPEPGKWAWERFDQKVAFLESQGIATGGLLLGVPVWNKKDHPHGFPMNSLPEWSNYVTKMVGHYKGKIRRWEVWNEPPNGTRNAPPADHAKLMVATYKAAKAADPECLVGLAAKSVHINYLEQVIQAGAKNHFDYITLHPYEVLGCVQDHPGTESIYMHIVPTLRKMLQAQNPEKANAPLRLTEIGYDARKGEGKQADALVKAFTMGIAQGMECINWYEGMDGDDGPKGLLRGDGTTRPSYTAMKELIANLGPHPTCLGWILLNGKHYGFLFQGPKGMVLSTWAATSTPDSVDFGQEVEILDPKLGTSVRASKFSLTTSPILVFGLPDSIGAQARENKAKPFPWDGDYTAAQEVSLTMGEKNTAKGLHLLASEKIAADVVMYGGNARAGDVPGGLTFVIDPNFLSYTSVPIEISIVAKRNDTNEPAKLTLEYESTDGYKKAPSWEVPEGDKWHTARWRIDDSQFVNTWAFSFRLNRDKFLIQSVTVKKL